MTWWTSSTASASAAPAIRCLIRPADRAASLSAPTTASDTWTPTRPHLDLIGELFGCDIALYPAHLATLNLAAREINDEANYPRIARRNFFDFAPRATVLPDSRRCRRTAARAAAAAGRGGRQPALCPPREGREEGQGPLRPDCSDAWPGLRLTGRSDLHCYFWPAAARLLKPDGYFGFLTSSSWLDVEYGFALQGWMLRHFRILAIMESAAEPWFEDARVKTCVTILQRCDDEAARMANRVRFVRFARKLADIIGVPPGRGRRSPAERASRHCASASCRPMPTAKIDDLRIIVKTQSDLWNDGVRAGAILGDAERWRPRRNARDGETRRGRSGSAEAAAMNHIQARSTATTGPASGADTSAPRTSTSTSCADFGSRFVALGEIADDPLRRQERLRCLLHAQGRHGRDAGHACRPTAPSASTAAVRRARTLNRASCGSSKPATGAFIPSRPSTWPPKSTA